MARYDLRLSEAEFWRLTPRQMQALMRRARMERETAQFHTGLIVSTIANIVRSKGQPLTPGDWFPALRCERRAQTPREALLVLLNGAGEARMDAESTEQIRRQLEALGEVGEA